MAKTIDRRAIMAQAPFYRGEDDKIIRVDPIQWNADFERERVINFPALDMLIFEYAKTMLHRGKTQTKGK